MMDIWQKHAKRVRRQAQLEERFHRDWKLFVGIGCLLVAVSGTGILLDPASAQFQESFFVGLFAIAVGLLERAPKEKP